MHELDRGSSGQRVLHRAAGRFRDREAEHRANALSARPERVADDVLGAPEVGSKRQRGEVCLDGVPELTQESVLRAEMANGSRIVALPGDERTIRGYASVDLVVVDEAARCEDALVTAVRPMLAVSQGRLIALTTPAGKRGWFYEAWTGDDSWHRVKVAATECPRISQAFLDEELRELGAQRFSEEYQLAWIDPDEAVFSSAIIDAAFSNTVRPLWA